MIIFFVNFERTPLLKMSSFLLGNIYEGGLLVTFLFHNFLLRHSRY